jgi:hypothetical protein
MKVGILTFHRSNNYGAVLQTYALQTVLEQLGFKSQIIDYVRPGKKESLFFSWWGVKNCIINGFTLLRYPKAKRRYERFQEFRKNFLLISRKSYYSCEELEKAPPRVDAFICGSDQIWRPVFNNDQLRVYYLDFVNSKESKKIAYAPSFGISTVSEEFMQFIRPLIDDIPYLSVREKTGQQIISQAVGREAQIVLDPSLLLRLKDWSRIALPPSIDPPYVLVYCLSQKRNFCDLVRHIKKITGLPVVVISPYALNLIPDADHVIFEAGPQEFVGLFANASCICTNSFHATAFSIINKRPFWTTPIRLANSRLADLLDMIGLSDHQVDRTEDFPDAPLEIDYSKAEKLLDEARSNSISFLKNALQD